MVCSQINLCSQESPSTGSAKWSVLRSTYVHKSHHLQVRLNGLFSDHSMFTRVHLQVQLNGLFLDRLGLQESPSTGSAKWSVLRSPRYSRVHLQVQLNGLFSGSQESPSTGSAKWSVLRSLYVHKSPSTGSAKWSVLRSPRFTSPSTGSAKI